MSTRDAFRKLQQRAETGPVVPGSILYRMLQHTARAIAKKLGDRTGEQDKSYPRKKRQAKHSKAIQ